MAELGLTKEQIEEALADTGGPKRARITRVTMYRSLRRLARSDDGKDKECLCISRSEELAQVLGIRKAKRTITSYPEVDMLRLPYAADSYDFVLSNQVLEHVAGSPFQAVAESVRVCKPGGWIVHTTCFINPLHQLPHDYWRFSPRALRLLMKTAGTEVVKIGGWGNRATLAYCDLGYRDHEIPEVEGNPVFELATRNEKKWPIVTWVAARKPM